MQNPFDPSFDALPDELPVFPLSGVILMPRTQLPLNVFEPRYLAMTRHALRHDGLIGMVQPLEKTADGKISLHKTGCAGRIVSFSETDDGRYLITLKGLCRFDIRAEKPLNDGGFRVVTPSWTDYAHDFSAPVENAVCRDSLCASLRGYLERMNMSCDKWEEMKSIDCDKLVSTLAVVCPLDAQEKQALLEAKTLSERAKMLQAFLDGEKSCACH